MKDLHDLIFTSESTREYFLSLPIPMQLRLHERGQHIHSAEQLRQHVHQLEQQPGRLL